MNWRYATVCLVVTLPCAVQAQQQRTWAFGMAAHVFSEARRSTTVAVGATVDWAQPGGLGIESSILFTSRIRGSFEAFGRVITPEGDDVLIDHVRKESYKSIELPVLGVARFGSVEDSPVLSVAAGPAVSYGFGCSATVDSVATSLITGREISRGMREITSCSSSRAGLDVNLVAGGGLGLKIGKTRLRISLQYFRIEKSDRVLTGTAQWYFRFW